MEDNGGDLASRLRRAKHLLSEVDRMVRCVSLDMGGNHRYSLAGANARRLMPEVYDFLANDPALPPEEGATE